MRKKESSKTMERLESTEILADVTLDFEENDQIFKGKSECERYGCTCINYEKCCSCLIQ